MNFKVSLFIYKLIQNNHENTAYTLIEVSMNKEYKVNNIFKEDGITLNDLISKIFTSFQDEDLSLFESNDIINLDIALNL